MTSPREIWSKVTDLAGLIWRLMGGKKLRVECIELRAENRNPFFWFSTPDSSLWTRIRS